MSPNFETKHITTEGIDALFRGEHGYVADMYGEYPRVVSSCWTKQHDVRFKVVTDQPRFGGDKYKDWKFFCVGCFTCEHLYWTCVGYKKPGEGKKLDFSKILGDET